MKIEFAQVLCAMDGDPMQEEDPRNQGKTRDLTLGRLCINALLSEFPNEQQSGAQKFDRFKLAMRIGNEEDPIEITAEDIALIKERVGKAYSAYAVGTVWTVLEGSDN